MATRRGTLAWESPWTEEPDGLQSMGSQDCHSWATEHRINESALESHTWWPSLWFPLQPSFPSSRSHSAEFSHIIPDLIVPAPFLCPVDVLNSRSWIPSPPLATQAFYLWFWSQFRWSLTPPHSEVWSSLLWAVITPLCFCVLCWSIYLVYYLFTFCLPKCRFFVFVFWLRPETCPIIVPWPGTEPRSLGVKVLNPNHRTTREIPRGSFTTILSTHLNKCILKWISNEYMCISIPSQHNVSSKNTALDGIIEISSYTKNNDKSELIWL